MNIPENFHLKSLKAEKKHDRPQHSSVKHKQ